MACRLSVASWLSAFSFLPAFQQIEAPTPSTRVSLAIGELEFTKSTARESENENDLLRAEQTERLAGVSMRHHSETGGLLQTGELAQKVLYSALH